VALRNLKIQTPGWNEHPGVAYLLLSIAFTYQRATRPEPCGSYKTLAAAGDSLQESVKKLTGSFSISNNLLATRADQIPFILGLKESRLLSF
jgi:hypothetical protein